MTAALLSSGRLGDRGPCCQPQWRRRRRCRRRCLRVVTNLPFTPLLCTGTLRRAGYHCRQAWRRGKGEFWAEWPLLKPRLWVIIPLLIFQYVHAIFTGMACASGAWEGA